MGKLDDLHTLVKLLDAFELPVSPILEYAIKEKEEELIQAGHIEEFNTSDTSDMQEYHEVGRSTYFSDFTPSRTRSNSETLRVEFPDGRVIQYPRASDTYIEVIKTCNPDSIHELNIVHAGINIVSKEYDDKYAKAQHEIGDGWLVFTNTPTRKKKEDLIRISEELELGLRVEVVMKGSNEVVEEEYASDSTRQKLRVVFPDGRVLQPKRVYEAVVEVVKYAGAEEVRNLGLIVCGDNLVLKQPRPRYVKACKPIGNGWLVNTCSSTPVKYAQIKHISDRLNLGINVDIIGGEETLNNDDIISSILSNTDMGKQRNVNQDRTMFSLNGSEYMSKGKFVRAVVGEYINKYPQATYSDLVQIFCPDLLEAGYRFKGLLCPIEEWNSWANEYKTKRYYVAGDDCIFQSSDGCQFYVNTQWTLESVKNVIEIAEREGFWVSSK